ncbi:MAG: N-acetyltransferase, partial [Emcibacteraceae bacterium]|nr:N-acetyltransferase [Emcibacteraceae bacterium]MDG1996637.1 N-acetyltransferase [Emcibacteraceae bacterium]
MSDIKLQNDDDNQAVEELLDLTFGTDRLKKAAYSLRQGVEAIASLSFVIHSNDQLIATLRFWPISIDGAAALLLGPIAVLPELQGQGHGIRLMKHGLNIAKEQGHARVMLVGDEAYYRKVGFSRSSAANITMPGQVDKSRLLAFALDEDAFIGISGLITKDKAS